MSAEPASAAGTAGGVGAAGTASAVAGLVTRFDHIAVAVPDLAPAAALYADLLGGTLIAGGDDDRLGLRTVQLRFPPGVKVELLSPLHPESYLAAYLDRHGPGFHHMTCFVRDVTEAARRLEEAGFRTVDTRTGTGWWDETFIRPSSGFGTLVQLTDSPLSWSEPVMPDGAGIADVLAGRIEWNEARPRWKATTHPE
ncbi:MULTISPECIES: VOC family protein [Prauserella salsuginis group]|uniref:Methylmalonyl-CoA epimerase n=2 Tax=Prauserella salsuginis group TaxID=2893672 RepID=A0A839XWU8_9PSEU|nr:MULTISPECIES: VOC family protein [Prauserella salsuginis group]MBB3665548.1 methylmalonyl-CoA epimerase [Prauserella sediminis]MCR3718754.1 methylmalonyl-CoA/ethylmalonyl-CoA epimerase [Prauserella flava]MCR3733324.1 methylmalonyl-CoA/ethylmalonyl-CoA epimerase [Prauserella salsuginis]